MVIFVDDLIITKSNTQLVNVTKGALLLEFEMIEMGLLHFFPFVWRFGRMNHERRTLFCKSGMFQELLEAFTSPMDTR